MSFIVNFDFDRNFPERKVDCNFKNRSLFEWLFFFVNKSSESVLYTTEKYSCEYLQQLEKFGCVIPQMTSDKSDLIPWWGNFENYEIKKKFISKINLLDTLKDYDLIPKFVSSLRSERDLVSLLEVEGRYFFREEYSFSGIGSCIYESGKQYDFKKGVVAPYLNVEYTFGVTVDLKNDHYFICRNNIESNGAFRGGEIIEPNDLSEILGVDTVTLKKDLSEIFSIFRKCGASGIVQFDSMIYNTNGKKYWYKVVEVNYRKTMGLLIKSLYDMFGKGEFVISTKENDGIQISPDNLKLKSFYIPSN